MMRAMRRARSGEDAKREPNQARRPPSPHKRMAGGPTAPTDYSQRYGLRVEELVHGAAPGAYLRNSPPLLSGGVRPSTGPPGSVERRWRGRSPRHLPSTDKGEIGGGARPPRAKAANSGDTFLEPPHGRALPHAGQSLTGAYVVRPHRRSKRQTQGEASGGMLQTNASWLKQNHVGVGRPLAHPFYSSYLRGI